MVVSRPTRRVQKTMALAAKSAGAGSTGTGTKRTSAQSYAINWGGALMGAIGGLVTGGPGGALAGAVAGAVSKGGDGARGGGAAPLVPQGCPPGLIRVGSQCVNPTAALPGGDPFVTTAGGQVVASGGGAVMGAFGFPAQQPDVEVRHHRTCGPGLVLGRDDLCYPKAVLGRRSRWRKWRQAPRPMMTGADMKAIRRAKRLQGDVAEMAKVVGLKTKKR